MPARSEFAAGFADPVRDSQTVFRAVMDAMAHPGRIVGVAPELTPPTPLTATSGAIVLCLCDSDTRLWIDDNSPPAVSEWLGFQTGAPLTGNPAEAAFALVLDGEASPSLGQFCLGTQEYPDRSTTLVMQVQSLTGGAPLRLTGPGIDGSTTIAPVGLPRDFLTHWAENRARFPRGVDVILCAPDSVVGLPRSVSLSPERV
ncbi:MAG: phosphonate C-P lyase system protein PhnH [Phyllobacteriaceae bacterium]|nr:phosphonate C-P lyase system protein PhnH [Phyllobacteriaceae bacterium]